MKMKWYWIFLLIGFTIWFLAFAKVTLWYEDGVSENISGEITEKIYRTDETYRFKIKIVNGTNETWIAVNGNTFDDYDIGDNITGDWPVLYTDFQRRGAGIWWLVTWGGIIGLMFWWMFLSTVFVSEMRVVRSHFDS